MVNIGALARRHNHDDMPVSLAVCTTWCEWRFSVRWALRNLNIQRWGWSGPGKLERTGRQILSLSEDAHES